MLFKLKYFGLILAVLGVIMSLNVVCEEDYQYNHSFQVFLRNRVENPEYAKMVLLEIAKISNSFEKWHKLYSWSGPYPEIHQMAYDNMIKTATTYEHWNTIRGIEECRLMIKYRLIRKPIDRSEWSSEAQAMWKKSLRKMLALACNFEQAKDVWQKAEGCEELRAEAKQKMEECADDFQDWQSFVSTLEKACLESTKGYKSGAKALDVCLMASGVHRDVQKGIEEMFASSTEKRHFQYLRSYSRNKEIQGHVENRLAQLSDK